MNLLDALVTLSFDRRPDEALAAHLGVNAGAVAILRDMATVMSALEPAQLERRELNLVASALDTVAGFHS